MKREIAECQQKGLEKGKCKGETWGMGRGRTGVQNPSKKCGKKRRKERGIKSRAGTGQGRIRKVLPSLF